MRLAPTAWWLPAAALLHIPPCVRAQAPDTIRPLPAVVAALEVVADSLCAYAARDAAAGIEVHVAFGGVLRPALTAYAVARCPRWPVPLVLRPGVRASTYRLTEFAWDLDTGQARVDFVWEGGVPNEVGLSWFKNGFTTRIGVDGSGRARFLQRAMLTYASDGMLRIMPDTGRPPP